jgi:hypothetical protein
MSVSKGLGVKFKGPILKNGLLTCERMRLTVFSFLFFHGCIILFSPSCHALGRVENAFLLIPTLWGSTKSTMSTLKLVKMKELVCFYTMSLIHSMSSFSQHLSKKGKRKQWKRGKKPKKLATLDFNMHFDFPIHEFFCKLLFCCLHQLVFFSKWCHVN